VDWVLEGQGGSPHAEEATAAPRAAERPSD